MACYPKHQLFNGARPAWSNILVFNAPEGHVTEVSSYGLEDDQEIPLLVKSEIGEYVPYLVDGRQVVLTSDNFSIVVEDGKTYKLDVSSIADNDDNVRVVSNSVVNSPLNVISSTEANFTPSSGGPAIPVEVIRYNNIDAPVVYELGTGRIIYNPQGTFTLGDGSTWVPPIGTEGQVLGYDENGNLIAMDIPGGGGGDLPAHSNYQLLQTRTGDPMFGKIRLGHFDHPVPIPDATHLIPYVTTMVNKENAMFSWTTGSFNPDPFAIAIRTGTPNGGRLKAASAIENNDVLTLGQFSSFVAPVYVVSNKPEVGNSNCMAIMPGAWAGHANPGANQGGSIAFGGIAEVNGLHCYAFGALSKVGPANEDGSFSRTTTGLQHSGAFGGATQVTVNNGWAFGARAKVYAVNSVSLGSDSETSDPNSVSVGNLTLRRRIINVAEAVNANDAVIKSQLDAVAETIPELSVFDTEAEATAWVGSNPRRIGLVRRIGGI